MCPHQVLIYSQAKATIKHSGGALSTPECIWLSPIQTSDIGVSVRYLCVEQETQSSRMLEREGWYAESDSVSSSPVTQAINDDGANNMDQQAITDNHVINKNEAVTENLPSDNERQAINDNELSTSPPKEDKTM